MRLGTFLSRRVAPVVILGAVLLGVGSNQASATITAILVSVAPNGIGGFTWTYSVTLASGFALDPGKTWSSTPDEQFFTIYDVFGFTGVTTQPAGWSLSSANTGVTPVVIAPADDASLPNVTWTYSGPFVGRAKKRVPLGTFTVDTLYGDITIRAVSSQDTMFGFPDVRNASLNATPVDEDDKDD